MPHTEAAGQVVAFIAAGVILMASLGALLWNASTDPIDDAPSEAASLDAGASDLLDVLAQPGTGWQVQPDGTAARIGLTGANGLDLDKLDLMRGAALDAQANGLLDYEDARASLLGSDAAHDFHIRIYPAGLTRSIAAADLSGLRTAYIGDWNTLPSITVPLHADAQVMFGNAQVQLNSTMLLATATERQMLRELGLGFDDQVHITTGYPTVLVQVALGIKVPMTSLVPLTLLEGDVYPDHKQYLDNVMAGRLAQYDLLVIGSGVDQNTMTSNVIKDGIRDWVQAGGTLIVLGTDKQNYQWLRPIFDTGVNTVNGAPKAPDSTHPLLRVPHELNWPYYDHHSHAWDIAGVDEALFERVVVVGVDEVLVVSKEGAFQDGRIFLTTYEPRDMAGTLGQQEAKNFLHNIVVYADREHLFLDYGPEVPEGVPVASASAQSWVIDDDLGFVPMRIDVLFWKT